MGFEKMRRDKIKQEIQVVTQLEHNHPSLAYRN